MTAALAEQEPWWEPGTKHGYHALTYGWLVGEVVRRISGKSLGTYFRDEVAGPLGLDFHIGLPAAHDARVAPLIPPPPPTPDELNLLTEILKDPESVLAKSFINPFIDIDRRTRAPGAPPRFPRPTATPTRARWRESTARWPAAARSTACACSVRTASTRASTEQADGTDAVLPLHTRFGLGFMLSTPKEKMGPNPHAFGHGGMGGSLAFADPDARARLRLRDERDAHRPVAARSAPRGAHPRAVRMPVSIASKHSRDTRVA